jgi:hypothetical protein
MSDGLDLMTAEIMAMRLNEMPERLPGFEGEVKQWAGPLGKRLGTGMCQLPAVVKGQRIELLLGRCPVVSPVANVDWINHDRRLFVPGNLGAELSVQLTIG